MSAVHCPLTGIDSFRMRSHNAPFTRCAHNAQGDRLLGIQLNRLSAVGPSAGCTSKTPNSLGSFRSCLANTILKRDPAWLIAAVTVPFEPLRVVYEAGRRN